MSTPTISFAPVVLPLARAAVVGGDAEAGKTLELELWLRDSPGEQPQEAEDLARLLWRGSLPASARSHGAAALEGVATFAQQLHERFQGGESQTPRPRLKPSNLTASRNRDLRRVELEAVAYAFLGEALPPEVKGFGLMLLAQWPRSAFRSFPRQGPELLQAWATYQRELAACERLLRAPGATSGSGAALMQVAYSPAALLQGSFYLGVLLSADANSRIQLTTLLQGGDSSVRLVQNFCHWASCRYALGALPPEKQPALVRGLGLEAFTAERDYLKSVEEVAALLGRAPGELILARDPFLGRLHCAALPEKALAPALEGWSTPRGLEYLAYLNRVGGWYLRKDKPSEALRLGELLEVVAAQYRRGDSLVSKRAAGASLSASRREVALAQRALATKLLESGIGIGLLNSWQQRESPERQRQLAAYTAVQALGNLNLQAAFRPLLEEVGPGLFPGGFLRRLEGCLKQSSKGGPVALNDAEILLVLLRERMGTWQEVVELIIAYAQALQGKQWDLFTWWEFLLDFEQYQEMPAAWVVSLLEKRK